MELDSGGVSLKKRFTLKNNNLAIRNSVIWGIILPCGFWRKMKSDKLDGNFLRFTVRNSKFLGHDRKCLAILPSLSPFLFEN